MRRSYLAGMLVVLAACGSATEPTHIETPNISMDVIQGTNIQATMGDTLLSTPIVVSVTKAANGRISLQGTGGSPAPNTLVEWHVVKGNGQMFVTQTYTDSVGQAKNYWYPLGTDSIKQIVQVRAIIDGQPQVVDSVITTALPPNYVEIELPRVTTGKYGIQNWYQYSDPFPINTSWDVSNILVKEFKGDSVTVVDTLPLTVISVQWKQEPGTALTNASVPTCSWTTATVTCPASERTEYDSTNAIVSQYQGYWLLTISASDSKNKTHEFSVWAKSVETVQP